MVAPSGLTGLTLRCRSKNPSIAASESYRQGLETVVTIYRNMVTQWDFMGKSWDITFAISWSDDSNGIWTWNWWFHDAKKALLMIRRGYTTQYIEDSQIQYDDNDLLTDWWWDITWLTHKGICGFCMACSVTEYGRLYDGWFMVWWEISWEYHTSEPRTKDLNNSIGYGWP